MIAQIPNFRCAMCKVVLAIRRTTVEARAVGFVETDVPAKKEAMMTPLKRGGLFSRKQK